MMGKCFFFRLKQIMGTCRTNNFCGNRQVVSLVFNAEQGLEVKVDLWCLSRVSDRGQFSQQFVHLSDTGVDLVFHLTISIFHFFRVAAGNRRCVWSYFEPAAGPRATKMFFWTWQVGRARQLCLLV